MNIYPFTCRCQQVSAAGIPLATSIAMSRVERIENEEKRQSQQRTEKRDAIDRTPSKAEGDEETVDEALRNDE
jgi:hypothetical protein